MGYYSLGELLIYKLCFVKTLAFKIILKYIIILSIWVTYWLRRTCHTVLYCLAKCFTGLIISYLGERAMHYLGLYPCLWQIPKKNLFHEPWKIHQQHHLETSFLSGGKLVPLAYCLYCSYRPKEVVLRSVCLFPKPEIAYCNKERECQISSRFLKIVCSYISL